jgi:hypothetical protein
LSPWSSFRFRLHYGIKAILVRRVMPPFKKMAAFYGDCVQTAREQVPDDEQVGAYRNRPWRS